MFCKVDFLKNSLLLVCAISWPATATEYQYINYGAPDFYDNGRESFSLNTDTREIISVDAVDSVSVCDEKNEFFCFQNSAISFYTPKHSLSINQKWAHGNVKFRVVRVQCFEMLGNAQDVWVIEADRAVMRLRIG